MSKFINYLNEDNIIETALNNYETLMGECIQMMNLYATYRFDRVFWRGTRSYTDQGMTDKIVPRKDRYPKHTNPIDHDLLDKEFQKKFGWKARSEGVFVTSNRTNALAYGIPYICIPADSFKYIWSKEINDLYIRINDIPSKELRRLSYGNIVSKYTDQNLKDALNRRAGNEVMFKCKYYYLVHPIHWDLMIEYGYWRKGKIK